VRVGQKATAIQKDRQTDAEADKNVFYPPNIEKKSDFAISWKDVFK